LAGRAGAVEDVCWTGFGGVGDGGSAAADAVTTMPAAAAAVASRSTHLRSDELLLSMDMESLLEDRWLIAGRYSTATPVTRTEQPPLPRCNPSLGILRAVPIVKDVE
jgi:hypothetical protein